MVRTRWTSETAGVRKPGWPGAWLASLGGPRRSVAALPAGAPWLTRGRSHNCWLGLELSTRDTASPWQVGCQGYPRPRGEHVHPRPPRRGSTPCWRVAAPPCGSAALTSKAGRRRRPVVRRWPAQSVHRDRPPGHRPVPAPQPPRLVLTLPGAMRSATGTVRPGPTTLAARASWGATHRPAEAPPGWFSSSAVEVGTVAQVASVSDQDGDPGWIVHLRSEALEGRGLSGVAAETRNVGDGDLASRGGDELVRAQGGEGSDHGVPGCGDQTGEVGLGERDVDLDAIGV